MNIVRLLILPCLGFILAAPANAAWTWTKLDYPGAIWTRANGISGDTIVGDYEDSTGRHGFLYDGSIWISLTDPDAEYGITVPRGISENRVAGYYRPDSFQEAGFIYDGFTWTNLQVTGITRVHGIYKNKVVGYYDYYDSYWDSPTNSGFVYDGGTFQNIRYPGAFSTQANAIWEDTIVGQYAGPILPASPGYAFIYDGQTWTTVAKEGAMSTRLTGIEGDRMVGAWYADRAAVGFLLQGDTWVDFESPWGTRIEPSGISGNRIVGVYRGTDGNDHGFLLTIPEPTAAALLAIGGLALARRRRLRPGRTR